MSIDKSLSNKGKLTRHRSVLTRSERVKILTDEGVWKDGRSMFGLPKIKTVKMRKKGKSAKDKGEEASTGTGE
ncbi:MAG: small basic protein [Planctomycetes bacterium]|nr:small basic protein [Planctomycetota bacterium]